MVLAHHLLPGDEEPVGHGGGEGLGEQHHTLEPRKLRRGPRGTLLRLSSRDRTMKVLSTRVKLCAISKYECRTSLKCAGTAMTALSTVGGTPGKGLFVR